MSDLMLDVDQASELKAAFRRGNWTNAEIKRASEGDFLARIRDVILGFSEIRPIQHSINTDADPFVPAGRSVKEEDQLPNRVRGLLTWDPAKVKLYLSKQQKGEKYIEGHKLRKELASQPVLNANVLDYLLAHPHLIPEEYKGKWVFFWGTIYRDSGGNPCVRHLDWDGSSWFWRCRWLDRGFNSRDPAVVAS